MSVTQLTCKYTCCVFKMTQGFKDSAIFLDVLTYGDLFRLQYLTQMTGQGKFCFNFDQI